MTNQKTTEEYKHTFDSMDIVVAVRYGLIGKWFKLASIKS